MLVQVWFSIVDQPRLTDEGRADLAQVADWYEFPEVIGERRLIHAIIELGAIEQVAGMLAARDKQPEIYAVSDYRGLRVPSYPINESGYLSYFPERVVEIDGVAVTHITPGHAFGGWPLWEEQRVGE